ncbi:hypothetical protein cypCar_00027093 [Cyprinus carpio]|nr:hypothetical protein cypCar_00027093 [Cyprinus carpio]
MDDPYQNNINQQGETYPTYGGGEYTYPYQADYPPQEEEDAASDVTEGHDEDEQMYEGEYQGIPHPDEIKEARRAARREARMKARMAAEVEEETLPEQYESIMEDCGHGRFQWTLFTVLGLALMADGVECFVVSFALPSAEKDMCLSNADKGMLGLIVYVGMMIGAVLWGSLADKLGRRQCLLYALAINCIFSFLIGGSVPIVYTYFAEFLQMDKRGEHLSWLCLFWMLGGLYYGLGAWFPDQIKYLQFEEYESNVKIFHREKVERFHFNFTLQNQVHKEGQYIHDRFINIEIRNVKFEESLFENCYFEDIRSTDTFFENCTLKNTVFYNTDLWEDSKFINCKLENTTFLHPKKGCHLNFQEENDILIYLVSFLGSLSVLPGNILACLLMDKIGRLKIIGGSMLGSAGCTFFVFLCFSQWAVVLFHCLFFAASAAAWNGIEVITVELYPASKRATAFGVLNGTCKLAAIISTFTFGKFIGITKIIPIILSLSALVCGGLLAFKLPETREVILQ